METEQIQLNSEEFKELNDQFNKKVCDYFESLKNQITWDNEYNIESELTKIKEIWSNVLCKKYEETIASKLKNKNISEDEVKKIHSEQLEKYENSWELIDDNVPVYFLKAFKKNTIDSREKLNKLIDFTKNGLKFKDDFYDDYFMYYIIDLLESGEKSTLTKDDLFYVLDLNKKKDLHPDTFLEYVKKFKLDYSCIEKLFSFAENYKLPDKENCNEDHEKQANVFFDLIRCMLLYSKGFTSNLDNVTKNSEIAQKIFAYINKNMLQFKHLFSEIDEYKKGVNLSSYLNKEGFIKICLPEKNSDGEDIGVAIDYFEWFNKFCAPFVNIYHSCMSFRKFSSVDELNKFRDKCILEFRNEINKCGIEITKDMEKELLFGKKSFNEILEKTDNNIVTSSDDFGKLIEFIDSKTREVDIDCYQFFCLIKDYILQMDDAKKFLGLCQKNRLSVSNITFFFLTKINTSQRYTSKDITELLSAAKDRFLESKNLKTKDNEEVKKDVKALCDLLAYFLKHADESKIEYIKFEQDIFDWIGTNISEVKFSKKIIKDSKLKDVLKHRWVKFNCFVNDKFKLEADFSDLQEQFESFVPNEFNLIKTKYQDLNELSKAYDTFIDKFLQSKRVDQIRLQKVNEAGYEKNLKQALKLRESISIYSFIENISSDIIKSSGDLKLFLENANKMIDEHVGALDSLLCDKCTMNLISNGSLDVDDILKFLGCFLPKKAKKAGQEETTKDKLTLRALLKYCQKIKDDQKWNLWQVKKFLEYGFANANTKKKIAKSVNSFFKLLIIFVNNADLKNKMYNSDLEKADIEDNEDIKNNVDMTYEKFVNEILVCAKKIYFKQKDFSWCVYFDCCESFAELQKILASKNINIPELQQNKLKDESKLGEEMESKNKKNKNEDGKKNEEKNKIQIEINSEGSNKNKIDQPKKFDLRIKTSHATNPKEKEEKIENINLKSNDQIQITNQNESNNNENEINEKNNKTGMTINNKGNLKTKLNSISQIKKTTSSSDNQNNNTSQTTQKIGGIPVINNSKHENITDRRPESNFMTTTKISCHKLISKIFLYALAIASFVVFIFSGIKAFWVLAILSFVFCFVFIFIAYKIKHKTTEKKTNQISTGYLNYQPENTEPNKNDELNPTQIPETIKDTRKKIKK